MTLHARFTDPGPEFSPLPIWWWSGARVRRDRLRWQMEQLISQGVRQAVVMCLAPTGPLFGSLADDPPFLSPQWIGLLDGACEDAAELGFSLWMYDQIGFSGANFQGRLTTANPEFAGLALSRDGISVSGFDYFGVEACAALLDQVHGELDRQVGRWFGTVIPGFFQDELPAMPTWGHDFAETFAARYGYDLDPAKLFEDGDPLVRRDYQQHRARLARRAFFDPLEKWFADRGLVCGFDQASPAREGDPAGGVTLYGDYLGTHKGFGAPGSDHWGDPKVHSSLAHAHGHPRTWIEAFHSSGWGGSLEETYDWLAPFLRRGANLYDPHAVYYSTAGGWWEWAPPSTCWRQPYWPSYHQFATAVTRLCSVLAGGTHVCDTVLLSPTSTAQAYTTPEGPLEPALRSARCFHRLNGVSTWYAEERGVLEQAGIDHDTLDEATIASGTADHKGLRIGEETYRTVVLPEVALLLPETAQRLSELAAAGGTVFCVGSVPDGLTGATQVDRPEDVRLPPPPVRADAPSLLRRYGDTFVLLLTAHDERTGTRAPIVRLDNDDWHNTGFPWEEYWRQLRENGYDFVPPAGRVARVEGLPARAQRWDPRTGARTELAVVDGVAEVPFTDGPMSLVVFGADLPPATRAPLGEPVGATVLDGPWRAVAGSTLDNSQGDLAAADRPGVLPIEVWRFEGGRIATFGPFAEGKQWSLSRGIRKDPVHNDTLGPKGYVPDEFLDWRHVAAGERVSVRTHLPLPERTGLFLAVGSSAARRVLVDGRELPAPGEGYQTFSTLPPETAGRTVSLEIEFTGDGGPVRASFAVVTDPDAYRRPEWVTGSPRREFEPAGIPEDTVVQVAADGACSVLVNGVEVGRQGDFSPYPGFREIRVHPYDLREYLRPGRNVIELRLVDCAAAVDGPGLGLISDAGWGTVHRRTTSRFLCARPRPHPLPGAHWLEPEAAQGNVVVPVIPDMAPGGERIEELRFPAPLGTTSMGIPTTLDTVVHIEDAEYKVLDGVVRLPEPLRGGTPVVLRISATDGRRGGALLDGPVAVEVTETGTTLLSWEELGLRTLGGQVRYRTTFTASGRTVLDLGEVRGTADVLVNGELVDRLVWAPWRTEITPRPGVNELEVVVRGTLAGYLDDASPTTAVAAGQVRTGLFGPVRLVHYGEEA
ncbi:hypothetical protein HFP15_23435 [Amycolatopsis sp. K13G38]|uniref:Glycoside hydrolase n=1 Tax=Amycolatopsis acididurans TaxID=2724524 RepID=A0ABX1J7Q2_9PSEU|nr:hypothetical protein [Amycolatopsis acididurans]NKQ55833.1 hypothetical protein [Amycolatopsis acididurans]